LKLIDVVSLSRRRRGDSSVRARVQHYSPPAVRSLVYDTLIRRTRARARLARERARTQTQTSTTQIRAAGEGERGATHKHRGWMSEPYRAAAAAAAAATRRAARWIRHRTHPHPPAPNPLSDNDCEFTPEHASYLPSLDIQPLSGFPIRTSKWLPRRFSLFFFFYFFPLPHSRHSNRKLYLPPLTSEQAHGTREGKI